jgi:hypothetical protein
VSGRLGLVRFKWAFLIGGVILLGGGGVAYLSAHASQPQEIDGTISSYVEYTQNGAYDRNELQISGDSNTYTLDKNSFHPGLPEEVYKDGKVQIWIDQGSTTIIAITLYDQNDQNPTKYTTDSYDNPASERSNTQTGGIVAGVIGAILIAIFPLTFVIAGARPDATRMAGGTAGGAVLAVPIAASATAMAATVGLSGDGKWYWDGAQWRSASPDRRYWWDGVSWQQVGVPASPSAAPPPVG